MMYIILFAQIRIACMVSKYRIGSAQVRFQYAHQQV